MTKNSFLSDNKRRISTADMVQMAMFAALLSVSAFISIPLPFPGAPHITLQNFCILLIALLFPWDQALMIVTVWMLLGIVGVPVFIGGKAGIGYLASNPWGGYTLAFLPTVFLMAYLRRNEYKRVRYTIISVLGAVLIDVLGMVYLRFYPQSGYNWTMAVTAGFIAFLPLDMVKAAVAAQIVPAFMKLKAANKGMAVNR